MPAPSAVKTKSPAGDQTAGTPGLNWSRLKTPSSPGVIFQPAGAALGATEILVMPDTWVDITAGDANADGIVDMTDYVIWFDNFGKTGATWPDGDFNGDGIVDMTDYVIWFGGFGGTAGPVGVVANVKVMSSANPLDVSSLAAWKSSVITDAMSDKAKALAVWRTVVSCQHQDSPPSEYLQWGDNVADPLKNFNVYGYSFCSIAASQVAALSRYVGLEARNFGIAGHNVAEVKWDGAWHMLDASLINWFTKPGADLASIDEIQADIAAWYATHPGYKGNPTALNTYQSGNGWTQWKTGGPQLVASCTFYDAGGWWPAKTHGWASTMQEYDGSYDNMQEDQASSLGYRVNIQLRPGEVITRNWSNKGLHVNMDIGGTPGSLTDVNGQGDMVYCPAYGDIAPGRIGNGTHVYTVPVGDSTLPLSAWRFDNLTNSGSGSPTLRLANTGTDGWLELRMPSSYVYLSGTVTFSAVVAAGGQIDVKFSDNNGTSWKNVANYTTSGVKTASLKSLCYRRYDYRLRFMLRGNGTGIDSMTISHDIQHSQRPLPALGQGDNVISFSAGQEGTVTIEGSSTSANASKQILYTDYGPALVNCSQYPPMITTYGATTGSLTQTISAPADIKRLRMSGYYRARDARDKWDVQVSYNGGATWTTVATWAGAYRDMTGYAEATGVPAGTRTAKVRFVGTQYNTTCLFNHRIDADYNIPNGGFHPVQITYLWTEGGVPKQDVHVAATPNETYHINCAVKPVVKSIILELAK